MIAKQLYRELLQRVASKAELCRALAVDNPLVSIISAYLKAMSHVIDERY